MIKFEGRNITKSEVSNCHSPGDGKIELNLTMKLCIFVCILQFSSLSNRHRKIRFLEILSNCIFFNIIQLKLNFNSGEKEVGSNMISRKGSQ